MKKQKKMKASGQKNIKPLQDLNLTSRFLFDEVMEDPQAHQDALSIIFGKDIPLLERTETEKELRVSPLSRTIRMDVFSMDGKEVPELILEDGATRIFLNIHGKNDDEVPKELRDFLHYLEDTTDQRAAASNSDRIKRIHDRVRKVKLNEKVGVKYMQAWEEKYYEREEGREEGHKEGRNYKLTELICKKLRKHCTVSEIADMLEEPEESIRSICDVAQTFAPDYDVDKIMEILSKNKET